jgi:hypothetical protein
MGKIVIWKIWSEDPEFSDYAEAEERAFSDGHVEDDLAAIIRCHVIYLMRDNADLKEVTITARAPDRVWRTFVYRRDWACKGGEV